MLTPQKRSQTPLKVPGRLLTPGEERGNPVPGRLILTKSVKSVNSGMLEVLTNSKTGTGREAYLSAQRPLSPPQGG